MAKREITVVVAAKNAMARGLASAGSALKKFGQGVGRFAMRAGKMLAGIGASVLGIGMLALRAYNTAEQAQRSLESAFRSFGEDVDNNVKKVQAFADAIQNETGLADENMVARAAQLKLMGVHTDALEAATRATVALEAAGMGEQQAIRAVAMARKGNFQMLRRYLPSVRMANTEAEKAAALNDEVNRRYKQQKDLLSTIGGRWGAFKNRVSDVLKEVGRMISETGWLQRVLIHASDAARRLGQRLNSFVKSERFQQLRRDIEGVVQALSKGDEARAEAVQAVTNVLIAAFARGAEIVVNTLRVAFPVLGKLLGKTAAMAWEAFKPRIRKDDATLQAEKELELDLDHETRKGPRGHVSQAQLEKEKREGRMERWEEGKGFQTGMQVERKEFRDAVNRRAAEIRYEELMGEELARNTDETDNLTAAQIELKGALENLRNVGRKRFEELAGATDGLNDDAGETIDIFGSMGDGIDDAGDSLSRHVASSQKARSALDKFRRLGHEVEELDFSGTGSIGAGATSAAGRAISGARTQATERQQAQRNVDMMQRSIKVQEQIRDYLKSNLEAS
jgi:hypothetical protein